jgi:hypothetical protein
LLQEYAENEKTSGRKDPVAARAERSFAASQAFGVNVCAVIGGLEPGFLRAFSSPRARKKTIYGVATEGPQPVRTHGPLGRKYIETPSHLRIVATERIKTKTTVFNKLHIL